VKDAAAIGVKGLALSAAFRRLLAALPLSSAVRLCLTGSAGYFSGGYASRNDGGTASNPNYPSSVRRSLTALDSSRAAESIYEQRQELFIT